MTGKPWFSCSLPPTMMGPHSNPEVELHNATTEDLTLQPKTDTVTPDITKVTDIPDVMPKQLTEDRLQALQQMQRTASFCKCISKHLSNRKHPNMKLISPYMSQDYSINMSQIQTRSSWPLSYLKHGNTQCLWKHMTNLVTRELLIHNAS